MFQVEIASVYLDRVKDGVVLARFARYVHPEAVQGVLAQTAGHHWGGRGGGAFRHGGTSQDGWQGCRK